MIDLYSFGISNIIRDKAKVYEDGQIKENRDEMGGKHISRTLRVEGSPKLNGILRSMQRAGVDEEELKGLVKAVRRLANSAYKKGENAGWKDGYNAGIPSGYGIYNRPELE